MPICTKKRSIGYLICIVVVFTVVLYQEQVTNLPRFVASERDDSVKFHEESAAPHQHLEAQLKQKEQQQEQHHEQEYQQQEQERVMGASDTTCPSPLIPASPELSEELDLSECEEQASSHPEFKISICPLKERQTCNSFSVVIERKDLDECQDSIDLPISTSKEEAKMVRNRLGPDSFEVSISGAQALSSVIPYKVSKPDLSWLCILIIC